MKCVTILSWLRPLKIAYQGSKINRVKLPRAKFCCSKLNILLQDLSPTLEIAPMVYIIRVKTNKACIVPARKPNVVYSLHSQSFCYGTFHRRMGSYHLTKIMRWQDLYLPICSKNLNQVYLLLHTQDFWKWCQTVSSTRMY